MSIARPISSYPTIFSFHELVLIIPHLPRVIRVVRVLCSLACHLSLFSHRYVIRIHNSLFFVVRPTKCPQLDMATHGTGLDTSCFSDVAPAAVQLPSTNADLVPLPSAVSNKCLAINFTMFVPHKYLVEL
jgi:hypothetical protein